MSSVGDRIDTVSASADRSVRELLLFGVALCLLFVLLATISWQFVDEIPGPQRPLPAVLGLLAVAFVGYLRSLRIAIHCPGSRQTVAVILFFSAAFRGVLLFSEPIQEIDIYRYLWDGAAVTSGVNPFRYSPEQVRSLPRVRLPKGQPDSSPDDLARLVAVRNSSPAMATILDRIHYGEVVTVYPPVSQAVFAAAVATTPRTATVQTYVRMMKAWLLLFDLGTVCVLLLLLRAVGRPLGWAVAYGWCPLVLKEFANSGHLDAIAVFLTTAAIYTAVRAFFPNTAHRTDGCSDGRGALMMGVLSAALLGLGVGAKLYPLVLAPLLLVVSLRRLGWRKSVLPSVTFAIVTAVSCFPMFADRGTMPVRERVRQQVEPTAPDQIVRNPPPLPGERSGMTGLSTETVSQTLPQSSSSGIQTFLERWEMNDFLFMVLIENLKPSASRVEAPWFVIVSNGVRERLAGQVSGALQIDTVQIDTVRATRLTARCLAGLVFAVVVLSLILRKSVPVDPGEFLRAGFLTVAWFWLLLPTQNPWYWIWAMPLIPFAGRRAWLAVSGVVLLYYLRFWFGYHWPNDQTVAWGYAGTAFFDFVVTWIEYGPWFVWLAFDRRCYRDAA